MNTSNQTYKELAIPYFKEVFDCIDKVMLKLNVPYYLIGASAIALELLKKGIKPSRGTKDIDFAIMISSTEEFDMIIRELSQYGFNEVKDSSWRLYNPNFNIVIDLLPFGKIEEDFTQNFNERYTGLHILGFREVLQNPKTVQIEEKSLQIPSLEGMVILKLIAWSDRPEFRDNDLYDILKIIEHYYDFNLDEIFEYHNDTFSDDDFDRFKISARVLGRKASKFLTISEEINTRILKTLTENTTDAQNSTIAKRWVREKDWELEYAVSILEEFKLGLVEKKY